MEHIFHLQSPLTDEPAAEYIPGNLNHKGTDIIDSFLKNDPQISPPKAEHINTENKAKKSAEDHNDLVSETLAKIYIEQMLYDMAIETYEKLSLKFHKSLWPCRKAFVRYRSSPVFLIPSQGRRLLI